RDEAAVVVDRVVDLETGPAAELVVFLAVAGRDVDQAGSRVHRHEIRGEHRRVAIDPRVPGHDARESLSGYGERERGAATLHPGQAQEGLEQRLGDDEGLAVEL